VLSNVSDIYGDYIMSPVTWSFTLADFGAESASVYVAGARLSTLHATFLTRTNEATNIQNQLALYFGVSALRIKGVHVLKTVDALAAFTFVITPSTSSNDTKTATWLANRFAKDMAALNTLSPFANWTSLSPLIRSIVGFFDFMVRFRVDHADCYHYSDSSCGVDDTHRAHKLPLR
jgi:hypothetical protein